MGSLYGVTSLKNASYASYRYGSTLRDSARTSAGSSTKRSGKSSSASKSKKKKKLTYNFKEVSGAIVRAKTSVGASQACIKARRRLVEMMNKEGSAEYDENEVRIAIEHAQAILRTAQRKKKHLSDEERAEREGGKYREDGTERTGLSDGETDEARVGADGPMAGMDQEQAGQAIEQQRAMQAQAQEQAEEMSEELAEEMEEQMRELEEEMEMEEQMAEMSEMLDPSMSEEDLEEVKRKHRAKEMMEITRADMKYLKAMFQLYEKEKSSSASSIGSAGCGGGGGYSAPTISLPVMVSAATPSAAEVVAEGMNVDVSG